MTKRGERFLDILTLALLVAIVIGNSPMAKALDNQNDYDHTKSYHFWSDTPSSTFQFRNTFGDTCDKTVNSTPLFLHARTNYTIAFAASSDSSSHDVSASLQFRSAIDNSTSGVASITPLQWESSSDFSSTSGVIQTLGTVPIAFAFGPIANQSIGPNNMTEVVLSFLPSINGYLNVTCPQATASETYIGNVNVKDTGFGFTVPISLFYSNVLTQCFTNCSNGNYSLIAIPTGILPDTTPNTANPFMVPVTCEPQVSNVTIPNQVWQFVNTSLTDSLYGQFFKVSSFGTPTPVGSTFKINFNTSINPNQNATLLFPSGRNSSQLPINDTGGYFFAVFPSTGQIYCIDVFSIGTPDYTPPNPQLTTDAVGLISQIVKPHVLQLISSLQPPNATVQTKSGIAATFAWAYDTPWGGGGRINNMGIILFVAAAVAIISQALGGGKVE